MNLKKHFETSGEWLFKRRGSFPLIAIPFVLIALKDAGSLERCCGAKAQMAWCIFSIAVSFFGLFLRCLTLGWVREGTSGRNTKGQVADRLNTTGMYSLVRHPLYLANFFIAFGYVLYIEVWWFVVIFILLFCVFYERVMYREESFLEEKFGEDFRKWAEHTTAFFPKLKNWVKPKSAFSWKMVLKREYSTFFGLIVGFIGTDFLVHLLSEQKIIFRYSWIVFFSIGFVTYWSLRLLRKNRLLDIKS